MTTRLTGLLICLAAAACGCSPSLNWREITPDGAGLTATFPCRPDRLTRSVSLSGAPRSMTVLACTADASTFALGFVESADAAQSPGILEVLTAASLANVQAHDVQRSSASVGAASSKLPAQRLSMSGRLPDGSALVQHVLFFERGPRAYQATVVGKNPSSEAVQTFFSGIRAPQ